MFIMFLMRSEIFSDLPFKINSTLPFFVGMSLTVVWEQRSSLFKVTLNEAFEGIIKDESAFDQYLTNAMLIGLRAST